MLLCAQFFVKAFEKARHNQSHLLTKLLDTCPKVWSIRSNCRTPDEVSCTRRKLHNKN
jgi:hypothetical protein